MAGSEVVMSNVGNSATTKSVVSASDAEVGRPGAVLNQEVPHNAAVKFEYDSSHVFPNLIKWRGTVLPGLVTRPFLWINLSIYVFGSICYQGYHDTCGVHLPKLTADDVHPALSLCVFFLAFYANSSYGRFQLEYTMLKGIEGTMRNIGILVRYNFAEKEGPLDEEGKPIFEGEELDAFRKFKMIELLRVLGAAYYLLYSCIYDGDKFVFNTAAAHKAGLLSVSEMERLDLEKNHSKTMQWYRLLSWAYGIVNEAVEENICHEVDADGLQGNILQIRADMNNVCFEAEMPIPLAYYHIITILTISCTMSFSYTCIFIAKDVLYVYWLIYVVIIFGLLGMREVAIQMSEPFGDDDSDLPVDNYVDNVLEFLTHYITSARLRPRASQKFHKDNHFVSNGQACVVTGQKVNKTINTGAEIEKKLALAALREKTLAGHVVDSDAEHAPAESTNS